MKRSPLALAAGFSLALFLFFLFHMRTGVGWGDAAIYVLRADTLRADLVDVRGYPLWVGIGHLFTRLPIFEMCYRIHLMNLMFAGATAFVLFLLIRRCGAKGPAAMLGAGLFCLSNVFWGVLDYSGPKPLFTTIFALTLILGLRWLEDRSTRRFALWIGAVVLSLFAHRFAVLTLPAMALLGAFGLWDRSEWMRSRTRRQWLVIAAGVAGACLVLAVGTYLVFREPIQRMFLGEGGAWKSTVFGFSLKALPKDTLYALGVFGFNLWPWGCVLVLIGFFRAFRNRRLFWFLVVAFLPDFAFAFQMNVGDRYNFFMPTLLIFGVFAGLGAQSVHDRIARRRPRFHPDGWAGVVAAAAILALGPILLWGMGTYCERWEEGPFDVRETKYYRYDRAFFFPSTRGYDGAERFIRDVFSLLPENSVVFLEWGPYGPARYLRHVEGYRRDLKIVNGVKGKSMARLLAEDGGRPVFAVISPWSNRRTTDLGPVKLLPAGHDDLYRCFLK